MRLLAAIRDTGGGELTGCWTAILSAWRVKCPSIGVANGVGRRALMGDFDFRAGGGWTSAVSGLGLRTGGRGFREGLLVICLDSLLVKAARISWGRRGSVRTNWMICVTCGKFADSSSFSGSGSTVYCTFFPGALFIFPHVLDATGRGKGVALTMSFDGNSISPTDEDAVGRTPS